MTHKTLVFHKKNKRVGPIPDNVKLLWWPRSWGHTNYASNTSSQFFAVFLLHHSIPEPCGRLECSSKGSPGCLGSKVCSKWWKSFRCSTGIVSKLDGDGLWAAIGHSSIQFLNCPLSFLSSVKTNESDSFGESCGNILAPWNHVGLLKLEKNVPEMLSQRILEVIIAPQDENIRSRSCWVKCFGSPDT